LSFHASILARGVGQPLSKQNSIFGDFFVRSKVLVNQGGVSQNEDSLLPEFDSRIDGSKAKGGKKRARAEHQVVKRWLHMAHRAEYQKENPEQYDEYSVAHLQCAALLVGGSSSLDQIIHSLDNTLATSFATARKTDFRDAVPAQSTTA
jgi:hypothetical protein